MTTSSHDVEDLLGIPVLRSRFLEFTREAYRSIARTTPGRTLDVGCGRGSVTLELARLNPRGRIVGIDVDEEAIRVLRKTIDDEGLEDRVEVLASSLLDTAFPDGAFHAVWEEGVLHLLDREKGLTQCRRLLAEDGHLVIAETTQWIDRATDALRRLGFESVTRVSWPTGCWWTDYYAPLEESIRRLADAGGSLLRAPALRRYEREIESVRREPAKFDCAHLVLKKVGS